VHERKETLEPKLRMLVLAPLVSNTKGWDALRAQEAAGLEALTGFAYMPSTLAKFTSALAISNAGPRLLARVGDRWHQVAQERWGEAGAMAALYVDNHAKEVWSSLFTQSGKVSHRNRVMPCITTTYVHTGAGTPLVASVQSGSAPLAPRLVQLVEDAERRVEGEGEVRRATIIDAEGSTFDILEAFAKKGRVIVTPLRPSRAPELELSYSQGSYFRPYRENDELRFANATLTPRAPAAPWSRALLLRREHRRATPCYSPPGRRWGWRAANWRTSTSPDGPSRRISSRRVAQSGWTSTAGIMGGWSPRVAVVTDLERLEQRAKADEQERGRLLSERSDSRRRSPPRS
jgi:hypothetical protein